MGVQRMFFVLLFIFFVSVSGWSQSATVQGIVTGVDEARKNTVLAGASLFWLHTTIGTTSDEEGRFSLEKPENVNQLVISYVGYQNDTVQVSTNTVLEIVLEPSITLDEVNVTYRRKATEISLMDPLKIEQIGEKEFLKAACCNLSESFETNPSIDVGFTDAVTGTRQIQMLGLSGPYIQISRENVPDVRGLSSVYGLTFIPGTWVQSLALSKGTGSVLNGYESIAGQIDVSLRNPAQEMDKLYLNLYTNEMGRLEANAHLKIPVSKKWSSALLLHGKSDQVQQDRNKDGFMDSPMGYGTVVLNRWGYQGNNGWEADFGAKGTYMDNRGGQLSFHHDTKNDIKHGWGMDLDLRRLDGWIKTGFVNANKPWQSAGLQLSATTHEQRSFFGKNNYDADQHSGYANLIYQSILGNTQHVIKTGMSFVYDNYHEVFNDEHYKRTEQVPGAFVEYAYNSLDKVNLVAGLRVDHHNLFGVFVTPRFHIRYALGEESVLRASVGRGQRTANIFVENSGLLASNRSWSILGNPDSDKPYGLDAEVAWNMGLNFTQKFQTGFRSGSFSVDAYRTQFQNQLVIDLDQNPQQVLVYNLNGESFSNSLQAQLDYEVIPRLDVRLAWRWFDVKTTFGDELLRKPLQSVQRAFLNVAYQTRNHWDFDYTLNWQGSKRIPFTGSNPVAYQLPEQSPAFFLMNAQASKSWRDEAFSVYVGVENLMNFRQDNPILAAENPNSPYFDSSLIWGPIFGRNVYAGVRYKLR